MGLNGESPWQFHVAQNISLILLSLIFLPLDTFILCCSYAARSFHGRLRLEGAQPCSPTTTTTSTKPRTILVTGVGMTKGLTLARAFYQAGHRVIGADFEPGWACGRFSTALSRFYVLRKPEATGKGSGPYVQTLLDVILREKVDLWVSCSGVASAVEDGEAKEVVEKRTGCRAIQFDVATTQMLHEKHTFIARTRHLGLNVPETHPITSRQAVDAALAKAPPGRQYILKTIGVDDAARGDILTLLPKAHPHETAAYLDRLRISDETPWILQQFVRGEEFCTHALVINGRVRAFVACPSAELLMHYRALPSDSALARAMLKFTETFAAAEGAAAVDEGQGGKGGGGGGGNGFTGHLSFDFLVEDTTPTDPAQIVLYPIECNPRAHTAVCLFTRAPDMVHGYLELLDGISKHDGPNCLATPTRNDRYYWVGHDLVTLVLAPLLALLRLQLSYREYIRSVATFVVRLLTWKDGTFELWDPLPWFALYHFYWPMQFWACLRQGRKWSRINVSTTKMFEC